MNAQAIEEKNLKKKKEKNNELKKSASMNLIFSWKSIYLFLGFAEHWNEQSSNKRNFNYFYSEASQQFTTSFFFIEQISVHSFYLAFYNV